MQDNKLNIGFSRHLPKILQSSKRKKIKPTLNSLLTLVESYKGDLDLDKILNTIGEHLLLLDISLVVLIFDENRQNLTVRHAVLAGSVHSLDPSGVYDIGGKSLSVKDLDGYAWSMKEKRSFLSHQQSSNLLYKIPEFKKAIDPKSRFSYIISPLIIRGEIIGIMDFMSPDLSEDELESFDDFSKSLVKIIANSLLFQEIKASEERYRNLIDNASEAVLIIDQKGYITLGNKAFFEMSGYSKNDLPGLHFTRLVHPGNRREMLLKFQKRLAGDLFRPENTFLSVNKQGLARQISYSIAPVKKGKLTLGMQVIARDVTENIELQKKLQDTKEHYKQVIDAISDSICVIDKNYRIVSYNKSFARHVGLPLKKVKDQDYREVIGRYANNLLKYPCLTEENGGCILERAFNKGTVQRHEVSGRDRFGQTKYFAYTAFPKKNENGSTYEMVITIKDISTRKSAEIELETLNRNLESLVHDRTAELENANRKLMQANSLKLKFISDASHELRTPLTVIQGNLELALRQLPKNIPEFTESVDLVLSEVDRMREILSDLTILTNVDSLNEQVYLETVDIGKTVEAAVRSLRVVANQKKIRLSYKENTKNYKLMGDEAKLEKMLLNIIRNAIKYTDTKGEVKVWTEADDNETRILIKDNGIGIPEQDLPFIFERFYRVDKARSRAEGGSGLGLSICKWIAEAHNGRITVESELGQGSTFTVHIPNIKQK